MARWEELPEFEREYLGKLPLPTFESTPWTPASALSESRVAIVSTAGLQRKGDRPFLEGTADFRVITGDVGADDLVMSHISVNFDRSGFQQDLNIVFPIDRLKELAEEGIVESVANFHYAFMGATDPREMEPTARHLAGLLKGDAVNAVLLVPV